MKNSLLQELPGKLIQKEFSLMQHEYCFRLVNGNRSIRAASRDISARVEALLGI